MFSAPPTPLMWLLAFLGFWFEFGFGSRCRSFWSSALSLREGVLPTVVSSGAIWTEIEPRFHIERRQTTPIATPHPRV